MKKIITLIFALVLISISFAQTSKDISIYRGKYKQFTFVKAGDYTTYDAYFTAKANRNLTSKRKIDLKNASAGGSDSEIALSYDGSVTTFTVSVEDSLTDNVTETRLDYDLIVDKSNKQTALFTGSLNVIPSVRTPFDNITNVTDLENFFAVSAKNLTVDYFIKVGTTATGEYIFTSDNKIDSAIIADSSFWDNLKNKPAKLLEDSTFVYQRLAEKIPYSDTTNNIAMQWELDAHTGNTSNPHSVTASQLSDYNSVWDTRLATKTTTNLTEGSNLYFTDERVDDRTAVLIQDGTGISWVYSDAGGTLTPTISLSPFSTTNLSEGTNLYYTDARWQAAWGLKTTADLTEGANLYYTDARARASISETVTGLTYTSGTGVFSLEAGYEMLQTTDRTNWNDAYSKRVNTWNYPLSISSNVISFGYNTTNLKLTANQLNTVQDIATTSAPTFAGLTSTGTISGTTLALNGTDINTAGTLTNVAYNNAWGIPKNGMKFDGVNDVVTFAATPFESPVPTKVSISIFFEINTKTGESRIFDVDGDESSIYHTGSSGTNKFSMRYWSGSNQSLETTNTFGDGTYHIVVLFDYGNSLKIYVNNVLEGSSTPSGALSTSWANMYFGSRNAATLFSDVKIYDVIIFNKILTTAEISDLWNNGKPQETEIPPEYQHGSQTALISGTLLVGQKYRIDTFVAGDDFTNVGGTNVTGNEFIATGTTPTTWTNSSSLRALGLMAEYKNFGSFGVVDSSPNRLNGNTTGSPISLSKGRAVEYIDYKGQITLNTTLTDIVPAGYKLESILFEETAGNAVTGGIKIGTTAGGTDVVAAETVTANSEGLMTLASDFFSTSADQTLYVQAVTAWNSASINLTFRMRKVK